MGNSSVIMVRLLPVTLSNSSVSRSRAFVGMRVGMTVEPVRLHLKLCFCHFLFHPRRLLLLLNEDRRWSRVTNSCSPALYPPLSFFVVRDAKVLWPTPDWTISAIRIRTATAHSFLHSTDKLYEQNGISKSGFGRASRPIGSLDEKIQARRIMELTCNFHPSKFLVIFSQIHSF